MEQEFDEVGRGYWHCPRLDEKKDSQDPHGPDTEQRDPALKADANLISSMCADGFHRPVLDLDIPAKLVPSSTPGNSHLYIDLPITPEKYMALLQALQDAGILQRGYAQAGIRRGATFVRPPNVKKPGAMLAEPEKYKSSKDKYEAYLKTLPQVQPGWDPTKILDGDPEGFGGSDF